MRCARRNAPLWRPLHRNPCRMPHRIRSSILLAISTCRTRINADSHARTIMHRRLRRAKAEWAHRTANWRSAYPRVATISSSTPRTSAHPGSLRSTPNSANLGPAETWISSWKWREAASGCSGLGPTDIVIWKKRLEFHNKNIHPNSQDRLTNPSTQSLASVELSPTTWRCLELSYNSRRRSWWY